MPWSNQGGGPWGSGGGGGGGGRGPWGSGPQPSGSPPDLEELLRRSQDKLKTVLPGGNLGGKGIALIALAAIAIWLFSGFYRVQPDEMGIVLRFGKYVQDATPGLNYHYPYPIELVLLPKVTRVNRIDIGMRLVEDLRRGSTVRDVPEESLMLTGDENIVDVDFSVFWVIKPKGAGDYLFNIQMPEGTVKAVAESAMREVVGSTDSEKITTVARQSIETDVQALMQKVLNSYEAGIQITQVQLQKVDPPTQVIDLLRDVQAARIDLERAQNEARTYANRVVPEAKGRAEQILQAAEAYKKQTVAEATGQTARFLSVYEQYKQAPDVTRQRMYLETMERLLATTDKIILDTGTGNGNGVVPYLPLDQLRPRPARCAAPAEGGRCTMRLNLVGGVVAAFILVVLIYRLRRDLHGLPVPSGAGRPAWPAGAGGDRSGTALQVAADRQRDHHRQANSRSRESGAGGDRLRPEAAGGRRLCALEGHRSAPVLPDGQHRRGRQFAAVDAVELGASPRARREFAHRCGARQARRVDGRGAKAA